MRSWSRIAVFVLALMGVTARAEPAGADQIVLVGGDRISGRIISITRDAVSIETPAAGIIRISRQSVERLTTDTERIVDLTSGERLVGRIIPSAANTVTVRSGILGDRRVRIDAIDTIHVPETMTPLEARGRGQGSPAGPFQQASAPPTPQPPTIGQEPESPDDIRKVFLRQATVLLSPGEVEVEAAFTYTHTQSVSSILNARFRQFQVPLAARVGLFDRAEGFVSIPVAHLRQDLGFADSVSSRHESGIGDVVAGLTYEVMRETARAPDVVASLAFVAPTGSQPDEAGLSLGAGHSAAHAGVQFIKTVDPVALFAGASYRHESDGRYFLGDGVHDINLGGATGYNFGFGFAVNDNVSLSMQLLGSYQPDLRADGQQVFASSREPVSLRYALTFRHSPVTYLEPSVVVGLNDDAPNFAIGMSFSHRLGRR